MQDRPTYDELLAAIERFLDEEAVPNLEGARGFHARVAANAIRIVRRELALEEGALATEWAGLNAILDPPSRPETRASLRDALRARNEALCERIRTSEGDDPPSSTTSGAPSETNSASATPPSLERDQAI